MVSLIERVSDFVVLVNSYPFYSREVWDKEKGIVRVYGKDNDRKKINYVIYPKKYYNRSYIEKNIMEQYKSCPLCTIGTPIKESESRKFVIPSNIKKSLPYVIIGAGILVPLAIFGLRRYYYES